ncbi:DNA-binding PadR family transcriptional regulator [Pullulanibacillus pueri]|uniref:PadR family transcriptional regulator n=1 Tax=Pullulanibacillus pueri TaxID=1437324 RepID=A0A8J3ELH6_9BACL|nr:PadR family transcriptional regulator [Pullulanibacillus pueri]MBM7680844.1 DNA-binding PadR family transcriptional regulator [Pullulanibacillus pueri]GGH78550.1 PadR family transcriptional regulator [Pullulanibacillus pueri]
MDRERLKGSIEILLLSLLLEQDSYGYDMTKKLRVLSDDSYRMNEETLYPALKRLENKECVTSYWSEEKEGQRRKYYSITEHGKKVLNDKLNHWRQINRLIDKTLGGAT